MKLIASSFLLSIVLSATHAMALGTLLVDSKGDAVRVSGIDAQTACPAGTRLPTVRELAVEAQARGAQGILEVGQVDPAHVPAGYQLVHFFNEEGTEDQFYFSPHGYKRLSDEFAQKTSNIWSSSNRRSYSDDFLTLSGSWGMIGGSYHLESVICVSN